MSPLGLLKHNSKFLITALTPAILSSIPLLWHREHEGKEPYAAFVILLMSVYWMTECVPLAVTAFIPVILYPLFGVLSTDQVTKVYLQDSIFFLFGGCILALSFEYSNLHSRLALKVMLLVGSKIPQLFFGIMMTTMFLSMWMNNTSTTAMMVPIVGAIIAELQKEMEEVDQHDEKKQMQLLEYQRIRRASIRRTLGESIDDEDDDLDSNFDSREVRQSRILSKVRSLRIMFLLGTAYASNIGGTGVITGSSSNVIALDLIRKDGDDPTRSENCHNLLKVSFLDWMVYNVPPMLINTFATWAYLQIHFVGIPPFLAFWRKKESEKTLRRSASSALALETRVKEVMNRKYGTLGSLTAHEIGVLILFVTMVFIWVLKDPQVIPGWDHLPIFQQGEHGKSYIKEATPTFLIAVLLCVIPSKSIYYTRVWSGGLSRGMKDPLLSWDFIYQKFPWGLFMLLGGGTGMAAGAKASGLNKWIGTQMESSSILRECPDAILLIIVLVLVSIMTTVSSNTACVAIVTPVLLGLAYAKHVHPLFLVLGGATVCSYAFVLPVSTPPNAIVYSSTTEIKLMDMAAPGLVVNVICILTLMLTTCTTSTWYFNFGGYANECAQQPS